MQREGNSGRRESEPAPSGGGASLWDRLKASTSWGVSPGNNGSAPGVFVSIGFPLSDPQPARGAPPGTQSVADLLAQRQQSAAPPPPSQAEQQRNAANGPPPAVPGPPSAEAQRNASNGPASFVPKAPSAEAQRNASTDVSPATPKAPASTEPSPTPSVPPPPSSSPEKKRSNANASILWPAHANATYRDVTADVRSETRQRERNMRENPDGVPVVGPFLGAKREAEELAAGKKPDLVTAARTVRVVLAATPAGKFPGANLPAKMATKAVVNKAAGKVVDGAKNREDSNNSHSDTGGGSGSSPQ